MDNSEKYDKIERYLVGEMRKKELSEIEKDSSLLEEIKLHKEITKANLEDEIINFREKIRNVVANQKQLKIGISLPHRWILISVAASIILVFGFAYLFMPNKHDQELFQDYFKSYPNVLSFRASNTDSDLNLALNSYTKRNYKLAINHFDVIGNQSDTIKFYTGLCYLSLKNPERAIDKLKEINSKSIFYQQARWYLGLAYVLKEDSQSALQVFMTIEENEFKFDESREILEEI